jgi:hypothetical protein
MGTIIGVSIQETPLRTFRGTLSHSQVEALIMMMNGHIFKGLLSMIKSRFAQE